MDDGTPIVLELPADYPDLRGGRTQPIPNEGKISALNIPHSAIVFDPYDTAEVTAELLGENGIATETIKHANIVCFICLKAIAYNDRQERKDAHDLVYCLEYVPQNIENIAAMFRQALGGPHRQVIELAIRLLHSRFSSDEIVEGYRKDGPVAVAKFELGEDEATREQRVLNQRQVSGMVEWFLGMVDASEGP